MKKSVFIYVGIFIIVLVAAIFLVPAIQQSVLGETIETIQWKENMVDVISKSVREGQFSFSNGDQLSMTASASQGKNAEIRAKGTDVTFHFTSLDVSKYETVEVFLNGKASVVDPPQKMGASSGIAVGLRKGGVSIHGCGIGADLSQTPRSISLFKIENKGGGFYRVITDCGAELVQVKDSNENINPYISVNAQTTSGALEHSATSSVTIYEIKKTGSIQESSPVEIQPITEAVQEITPDKEVQTELIAESSLSQAEKEMVVATLATTKNEQEELKLLLLEIQNERKDSEQRIIFIIMGASVVLLGTIITVILVRKKKR